MKQCNDKPFPHKSQQRLITFCRATTSLRGQRQAGNLSFPWKKKAWHVSVTFRDKLRVITTKMGASQCRITRINNLVPVRNYERSSSQGCGTSLLSSNGKSPQSIAAHLDECPLKGASWGHHAGTCGRSDSRKETSPRSGRLFQWIQSRGRTKEHWSHWSRSKGSISWHGGTGWRKEAGCWYRRVIHFLRHWPDVFPCKCLPLKSSW